MNDNDISSLINMISNMDKSKLAEGASKLNNILSDEDKRKLMQILNNRK